MKKILLALAMLLSPTALADWVLNSLSVNATSQTVTLDSPVTTIWVKNTGSTNEVFVCPWRNGETIIACTSTIGRQLDAGEAKSWTLGTIPGQTWRAISVICSTGETTTIRGDSLP